MFEPLKTILHDENYDILVEYHIKYNEYSVSILDKKVTKEETYDEFGDILFIVEKTIYSTSFQAPNHKEAEKKAIELVTEYLRKNNMIPLKNI